MPRVTVLALDEAARPILEPVARGVARGLGCEATVGAAPAFDVGRCFDAGRGQYDAASILAALAAPGDTISGGSAANGSPAQPCPARGPAVYRLALTTVDLFLPVLTHVFGAAPVGGSVAVVSTQRLDPVAYGLPADPGRLIERATREGLHELGHAFGLRHCRDATCLMRACRVVEEVDARDDGYCAACGDPLDRAGLRPRRRA
jgi:archaemetzincin